MYCSTPAFESVCPAGSYCVERTTTPMTCDYTYLLENAPYSSKENEDIQA